MVKKITHDLLMGDVRVKSLAELQEHATDDLITYFRDGRLLSFLETRNEPDLIEKIRSIQVQKDHEILECLVNILDIEEPIKTTRNQQQKETNEQDVQEKNTTRHEIFDSLDNIADTDNDITRTQTQQSKETIIRDTPQNNTTPNENHKFTYNIAVVGITGSGKSQFINYLCDSEVAKSGVGKPVTRNGFHAIPYTINQLPVTIFDSWGIEIETYQQWLKELNEELKNRTVDKFADQWFHSIYYCVNGGSSRIQDSDIRIIRRFLDEKYNVNVILTKADSLSDEAIAEFTACIKKEVSDDVAVIPVCSITEVRRGYTITPFGKEDINKQVYLDFWDAIVKRLPGRCEYVLNKKIEDWSESQRTHIRDNLNTSLFGGNKSEIEETIKSKLEDIKQEIGLLAIQEIKTTIKMYNQIFSSMVINFDEFERIQLKETNSGDFFDDNWIENIAKGVFFAVFFIPVAIYLSLFGNSNEMDELMQKINDIEEELIKEIPSLMKKVEAHLEEEKRIKIQQFRELNLE